MPGPVGTERSNQPTITEMIAIFNASHRDLVQELNNNHNLMMTAVKNDHKDLINGLKYVPVFSSNRQDNANNLLCRRLQNKASVHSSTQTGDTKATMKTTGSQASSSKTTQATATTASDTSTRASQATTESGSQRSNSPHDSHLSQREHTDSSPELEWDEEL